MSVYYNTSLTITGKKTDLIIILKYLNNYNKNSVKIYFNGMKVKFADKRFPKYFNNDFCINNDIQCINDEELEENLNNLDDNKEYSIYITANGPYGKFATIGEVDFFKELANISLDITFDGRIEGGESIPEDRLEVKYSNKKLYSKYFQFYDDSEDNNDIYIEEIEKLLPYSKFCKLFKIDKSNFSELDYDYFVLEEIGIQYFPYFYSYNEFIKKYEVSAINKEEYQEAIKKVEKLELPNLEEFEESKNDNFDIYEYDSITRTWKKVDIGDNNLVSIANKKNDDVDTEFKIGDTIMHINFGKGTVIEVGKKFITISFGKKYGIKKIIKNHESIKKI